MEIILIRVLPVYTKSKSIDFLQINSKYKHLIKHPHYLPRLIYVPSFLLLLIKEI